jgi:hypothetical protein
MDPIAVAALVVGVYLVLRASLSVVRTFVVPRATNDVIARVVFRSIRRVFDFLVARAGSYRQADALMSYFGPIALMALPIAWIVTDGAGFALIYWAVGIRPLDEAIAVSGSSLLTLGFARPDAPAGDWLVFSEAVIGLGTIALLISYLPTIYSAFSRREVLVRLLETRAGSPPSPVVLIERMRALGELGTARDLWADWERWFAELEETHTSLTVLVHFRSPRPDRSWVNAAGTVLDAAGLIESALTTRIDRSAEVMTRTGGVALRRIVTVFHMPLDPSPRPDRVRVPRATFDAAVAALGDAGCPIGPDREAAWRSFVAWRAAYDEPLLRLERLTVAPPPWWQLPIPATSTADTVPSSAEGAAAAGQE